MTLIASDKLSVIIGLGVTGLSVARFLKKKDLPFLVMDTRQQPPCLQEFRLAFPEIKLILGKLDVDMLLAATEIVTSPGISIKTPEIAAAIKQGIAVIGDVELFAREVKKPVVAITGSNAKTTVTTLVGQMAKDAGLKVIVAGNIGTALLDTLDKPADLYVIELSSFQLETTYSLRPQVATILNISADHMDRYDSLADYHRAKQRVYLNAQSIVVNRADPLTQAPLAKGTQCISFAADTPDRHGFGLINRDGRDYLAYEFSTLLAVDELQVRGQHNVANCAAALAIGMLAKLPMPSMLNSLKQFQGLPHRCQWFANINGVDFINDSKATNVGATLAALKGFANQQSKNIILIAGGQAKDADFSLLVPVLAETVHLVILIGKDADKLDRAINKAVQIHHAGDLRDAVQLAKKQASGGDLVLLSPACASFDMFSGYQDRGEQFMLAVKEAA
ncbi:MAG: UDP-N-acetylmuramoyl-L-alanine--D-glutamate ligase [Pseudomonadota bacterium]